MAEKASTGARGELEAEELSDLVTCDRVWRFHGAELVRELDGPRVEASVANHGSLLGWVLA